MVCLILFSVLFNYIYYTMEEIKKELTILHFNDVYDIQPDPKGSLGFLNFYDYVQQMRTIYPEALLIFSGDAFAPSKLSRALQGEQMAHCLSLLKIDIACYGNHDFDFQPQHCLQLAKRCGCPWLLGNIKYLSTGQNIGNGLDYYIIEHCGIKIGFMGLAGPDFNGRLISAYHKKLKYIDIVEYAKKMCGMLLGQGCELIIALTHARMPADTELAKQVRQIDIILGGHDHSPIFQIINETPIVKSSSNFECLSIVKLFQGKTNKVKTGVRLGRRWKYSHEFKKVKKAVNQYPQIEAYIKDAVEQYRHYERKKSTANNRPKQEHKSLPKNRWLLEHNFVNNRPTITLSAGLSAEVCFAKYVAFKTNCFYSGYKQAAPTGRPNFVEETLKFIKAEIISHSDHGKTALYSPGICSVPYLVETGNMVYLPSQFLVGITVLDDLLTILDIARSKGYKCYAVLGYDPFIKDKICAWIKFIQIPNDYVQLINTLHIENVIIMSCHDASGGENHGSQRNARLIYRENMPQEDNGPKSKDVYAMFIEESYNKSISKDRQKFQQIIKDRDQSFWLEASQRAICPYIHDWQSGIDCINTLQQKFLQVSSEKINFYYILDADSWRLYLVAYYVGKIFIQYNFHEEKHPVKPTGVVFNQYIFSNPTYELYYGYIPILYWQFYSKNQQRILQILTEEEKQMKRWFNMHSGTRISLIKHDSTKISTDHVGLQLARWITKHAPLAYNLIYLPLEIILNALSKQGLLFVKGNEGLVRQ